MTHQWLYRRWWAWLTLPVSLMYGLLVTVHRCYYRYLPHKLKRLPVPVIVIGNLIAGGAGKTPVCLALIRHLQAQGWSPGVVSRGYGRDKKTAADYLEVEVDTPAALCGDEPLLLKQRTHVPIMVGPRRFEAGVRLLQQHPEVNVLVLDDGLQHRQLHTDVRIVVFDERGLGNGWLLPAGLLREPWPTPHHAQDFVLCPASSPTKPHLKRAHQRLMSAFRQAPPLGIFFVQRSLSPMAHAPCGKTQRVSDLVHLPSLALAGIAKPEQFFDMLTHNGIALAKTLALADHAHLQDIDFAALQAYPQWFMTEKDSVKLFPVWKHIRASLAQAHPTQALPQLWAVPLEVQIAPDFFTAFDERLSFLNGHTTS